MKTSLAILTGIAILASAILGLWHLSAARASSSTQRASTLLQLPPATPAGQTTQWGHIKSLTRTGGRYEMRFDPAWVLHGTAAEQAALEATGSKDVPNDYIIADESHRLYTYTVAANAHVTVLSKGLRAVSIPVSELAQIVKGQNPKHRPLFDTANGLGYWIRIGTKYPNPVLSIDQQYQP
jgi:hypothetical protein